MTTDNQLLRLVSEALLDAMRPDKFRNHDLQYRARTAITAALTQPAHASTSGWIETVGSAPVKLDWSEPAPTEQPSQAGEVVAWGLFVRIEDGFWNLQHPVRFKQEDAEADISMYERHHQFKIEPLYTAPPKPVPMTPEECADLASNHFAEQWAQDKAVMLIGDVEAHHYITSKGE